jgi:hypothetical protein
MNAEFSVWYGQRFLEEEEGSLEHLSPEVPREKLFVIRHRKDRLKEK